ncbi:MAG: hypothetical protein HYU73_27990 [Betaproteobacteria bacterium]|nr:hypothetical protein [Betaproteobacteria bacterium]
MTSLAASTKLGGERTEGPAPVSEGGHRTDAAVFDLRRGTRLVGPRNDSGRSATRATAAVFRSVVRGGKSAAVQHAALDCHEQTPMTIKSVFNLLPRLATFNTSPRNILQFANNGLSYHCARGFAVDPAGNRGAHAGCLMMSRLFRSKLHTDLEPLKSLKTNA